MTKSICGTRWPLTPVRLCFFAKHNSPIYHHCSPSFLYSSRIDNAKNRASDPKYINVGLSVCPVFGRVLGEFLLHCLHSSLIRPRLTDWMLPTGQPRKCDGCWDHEEVPKLRRSREICFETVQAVSRQGQKYGYIVVILSIELHATPTIGALYVLFVCYSSSTSHNRSHGKGLQQLVSSPVHITAA